MLFVGTGQFSDYIYRHTALHTLSLIEFVSNICLVKKNEANLTIAVLEDGESETGKQWSDRSFFVLREGHPLFFSHILKHRNVSVIPDIIGPRIPDKKTLSTKEERAQYALIELVV